MYRFQPAMLLIVQTPDIITANPQNS